MVMVVVVVVVAVAVVAAVVVVAVVVNRRLDFYELVVRACCKYGNNLPVWSVL